jgi:hypothetical protein
VGTGGIILLHINAYGNMKENMFIAKKFVYMFRASSVIPWINYPILLSQTELYPAVFFEECDYPGCGVLLFHIGDTYYPCFIGDDERTADAWDKMQKKRIRKAFKKKRLLSIATTSYTCCTGDWFSYPQEVLVAYRAFLAKKGVTYASLDEMMCDGTYLPDLCRHTLVGDKEYYVFHSALLQGGCFDDEYFLTGDYSKWDPVLLYTALLKE